MVAEIQILPSSVTCSVEGLEVEALAQKDRWTLVIPTKRGRFVFKKTLATYASANALRGAVLAKGVIDMAWWYFERSEN